MTQRVFAAMLAAKRVVGASLISPGTRRTACVTSTILVEGCVVKQGAKPERESRAAKSAAMEPDITFGAPGHAKRATSDAPI